MKNCALCFTEFIQENEAMSNQSKNFASFCPKCFQSTAKLVDLNRQMEFYQKRITDLVLNISLGILRRRGKSANAFANSSGEKLIGFDVSALPNYESTDVSTWEVNASSTKESHNDVLVLENTYSYTNELSDPLLPTSASTGCENVNVKIEQSSEMFVDETQNIDEQFEENERRPIHIENNPYNCLNGNDAGISSGENLGSQQIFSLSTEATNYIPRQPYAIVSAGGSKKRKTKQIATRVHNSNIDFNPEKPYECHVCHKRVTKPHHLRVHMRIHTGERPFICAICKKAFTTKPNLVAHEIIHTGEKPYSCDLCLKRFNNESNLIHHKKLHTAEKPYKCDECEFSTSEKCNLKNHKIRKHLVS